FRSLCELPGYPSALCPSNPDSLTAISLMIDQVVSLHPAIQHFHIGADEVYHLGLCERCKKKMMSENLTPQQLFFVHV
ncbi:family 20 glycosylhydrolase, partial [Staphylococcus aureus]|nr:family 20 glycosylhydrolase [Staphylococcus aureus]